MSGPHDAPDIAQLVAAVREFLEQDVMAATEGRTRFHARVAVNVLRVVERELVLGPEQERAHAARLRSLDVASEAELAHAIRTGALDARLEDVIGVVRETVREKLEVANPGHLEAG